MKKIISLNLAIIFLTFSCVPRAKVVYLQDERGLKDARTGVVVEGYQLKDFEYRLKPEDIVSVKVTTLTTTEYNFFAESERQVGGVPNPLLSGYLIDKEGFIQLPVVDKIMVKGLTISEAQDKLKVALDSYLQSPNVILKLLSFHFTIVGEVRSPGRYTTYDNKINILEAIGTAGDFMDFADRAQIKIVRYEGDNASIFYLNVLEDDLLNSPYFYLQPGDFISVPPLPVKNVRMYVITNVGMVFSTLTALTFIILRLSGNN
ncbi:MAG: polysaccharide export protein [Bacteroidota bacterium]|nr:polysaccharide export protein [Bacteroidota bacterium]